ncbi:protein-L-isoaspartate O-methyltransferase family protein [Chthonobacter rhizosphaerae]|uniref:protein-L-isoaspartate O-methyltransferase family protein n=1 Tax=Chthonobacter rhizosphaerae TaxID=2735553 RepID=UPI0015EE697C|nr:protein-L-isoaspartate O-methyltransferase [Chthonobacter rhizosphaerae]
MADTAALRTKMVDGQIRPNDVTDHRIIDAMLTVPREAFVPPALRKLAYIDQNLLVGGDPTPRYMLQPMITARLIQQADIASTDTVLEVGATTGYTAAILSRLARKVVALEEDASLAEVARAAIAGQGIHTVEVVTGPLAAGWPAGAPYNVIIVSGAVEVLPDALADQLAEGGRLLVVLGTGQAARGMLYTRSGAEISGRVLMNAAVPLLPGFAREPAFEF